MARLIDEPEEEMPPDQDDARSARLAEARRALGFPNVAQAAEHYDLPPSTWNSNENGNRPLTKKKAHIYASVLGLNYEWLWSGIGEMRLVSDKTSDVPAPNASPPISMVASSGKLIPIRGRAIGGAEGAIVLNSSPDDYFPCPRHLDRVEDAYCVEVVGDSMEPRYFAGEIVCVNPSRTVQGNSFVIVQIDDKRGEVRAYVKRFVRWTDTHLVLSQLNPPDELRFERAHVEGVHLIVQSGVR